MTKNVVRVGIVQFDVRRGRVQANVERAIRAVIRMADKGARLLILPEMWSTGFANSSIQGLSATTPDVLEKLSRLAQAHRVTIIGSVPEKDGGSVYNTAYIVDRDGTISEGYRKIHLFSTTL